MNCQSCDTEFHIKLVHLGKAKMSYRPCLVLNANGLISNVSLDTLCFQFFLYSYRSVEMKHSNEMLVFCKDLLLVHSRHLINVLVMKQQVDGFESTANIGCTCFQMNISILYSQSILAKTKQPCEKCVVLNANGLISIISLDCSVLSIFCRATRSVEMKHCVKPFSLLVGFICVMSYVHVIRINLCIFTLSFSFCT